MLGLLLIEPDKPAGVDHLGRQEPRPAKFADDLPKGEVGKPRHRGLQDRRIDQQRADAERASRGGGR